MLGAFLINSPLSSLYLSPADYVQDRLVTATLRPGLAKFMVLTKRGIPGKRFTPHVNAGAKHDGPYVDPLKCRLAPPHGIWADANGTMFVGDLENHSLRVLKK